MVNSGTRAAVVKLGPDVRDHVAREACGACLARGGAHREAQSSRREKADALNRRDACFEQFEQRKLYLLLLLPRFWGRGGVRSSAADSSLCVPACREMQQPAPDGGGTHAGCSCVQTFAYTLFMIVFTESTQQ